MKRKLIHGILAFAASGVLLAAQSTPPPQTAPMTQGASTDSEMTSKIRQALMNDTSVGTAAQHIRVATKNGMVTLKGKVQSSEERDAAVTRAKQIAGDSNVKDDITVAKK